MTIQEIDARLAQIRSEIDGEGADITALTNEVDTLQANRAQLVTAAENRSALLNRIANMQGSPVMPQEERSADNILSTPEYRSAWFKNIMGRELNAQERAAFSTGSGSAGPAIPTTTAEKFARKLYDRVPVLEKCTIFHVPGFLNIPVEGAVAEASVHTELASISAGTDTLGKVALTGHEIIKLVGVSRAASAMTIDGFEDYVLKIIADFVGAKIEKDILTATSGGPVGVAVAGAGASGAYTDGTDQITVAAASTVAEADIVGLYALLGDGYERNAIWTMSKETYYSYFYPLMNSGKNVTVAQVNGQNFILGCPVYFSSSLSKGVAYLGDFSYIYGNFSRDLNITRSNDALLAYNEIAYLGECVFDSAPAAGIGAFVKFVKAQT